MLEVSESKLAQYVVHYVSDTLVYGEEAFSQPEVMLEAAFTQLAFNKLDFEQQYEFFHETAIGLNEVYTYVKAIFDEDASFLEQSKISLATYIVHLGIRILKVASCLLAYLTIVFCLQSQRKLLPLSKLKKKKCF